MAKPSSTKKGPEKDAKKSKIKVPRKQRQAKRARISTPPPKAKSASKPTARPSTQTKSLSKKPTSTENKPEALPSNFKVVAGSYEKLLYGLDGSTSLNEDGKLEYHLKPIFIFPAHVSCIKAVAASPQGGKWLATGSADEIIKIWDLRRRKEVGGLMHHEGSITHLSFPSRSYLLSSSEDGTMCLFRARDWAVLRSLKGHKGRVNAVAVHPSGKVALTVGKDRTLRMWDLMRGKGCASTKIGKEGEGIQWSTSGSLFAVQSGSTIDIYSAELDLLHVINHPSRLHDICFCKLVNGEGEVLLAAGEDKKVTLYSLHSDRSQSPTACAQMVGHENRVKTVKTLQISLPAGCGRGSTCIVATASSDGKIHIYDMNDVPTPTTKSEEPTQISPVAQYNSFGTRLTCLTLADGDSEETQITNSKRKRVEEDGSGSEDEDEEAGEGAGFGGEWEDEGDEENNESDGGSD